MVNIPNPPVRALYTERRPHQKVQRKAWGEKKRGGGEGVQEKRGWVERGWEGRKKKLRDRRELIFCQTGIASVESPWNINEHREAGICVHNNPNL